jgi:hypothetical protein
MRRERLVDASAAIESASLLDAGSLDLTTPPADRKLTASSLGVVKQFGIAERGARQNTRALEDSRPDNGGSAGARTQDQYLKRVLLYQLSYRPVRLVYGKSLRSPPLRGGGMILQRRADAARIAFSRARSRGSEPAASSAAYFAMRCRRSLASFAASLFGYFCVTCVNVVRASPIFFSSYCV